MKARRFSEEGLERFRAWIIDVRAIAKAGGEVPPVPDDLLVDDRYATATEYELPAKEPIFNTKMDIGIFCCQLVPDTHHEVVRGDAAFWSWLAARYFKQLTKGRTKIKEPRAYVAAIGFQEFYRHLMLGPYYIYFAARDVPERVCVLLYDEPTTMNEVMVQFGSYQTLMQNPEIQTVIQRLYFDTTKNRIKRGAGGKVNGAPRRLMDFFRQIEMNYDLRRISAQQMWDMLPAEFARFKGQSSTVL